jgi:hypothetical protein
VSATIPSLDPFLDDSLRDLHEQYIDAVNRAVAEGRGDLVAALASAYTDDAVVLMSRLLPFAA